MWKHICQYQWSWDKPYSPGCNHLCPMLQFGSKHVCIEDVHIFKHCHEMTLFLLWIGTYCISCVVQQTSGVKDLSSLVRYDDSSLAAIRHVQSIIPVVRPRPNIRSHSVLFIVTIFLVILSMFWNSFFVHLITPPLYCNKATAPVVYIFDFVFAIHFGLSHVLIPKNILHLLLLHFIKFPGTCTPPHAPP